MMKIWKYYIPATIWVILIFILCTLPGKDVPTTSFLQKIHFDKIVHFGLFGGIVLLMSLGVYWQRKYISGLTLFMFVLMAACYGLAIEYIQKYWAIDRSFDMMDVLADTLGAIAGVIAFKVAVRLFFKKDDA
ncbi:VanZ family protein [Chitinophaga solisilvae]|uniref:VanZ family protein n=1 Tax=Chitinophaga solisilvae TaxID=1233460 RepID=A0A9Q5D8Z7_9BACT|nr:VanZ family protein [Chitinophaga solisilvae]NSL89088.1 VanZ family protein [Chitinophaga solisilvae]